MEGFYFGQACLEFGVPLRAGYYISDLGLNQETYSSLIALFVSFT